MLCQSASKFLKQTAASFTSASHLTGLGKEKRKKRSSKEIHHIQSIHFPLFDTFFYINKSDFSLSYLYAAARIDENDVRQHYCILIQ